MKILHTIAIIGLTSTLLLASTQTQEEAKMQEITKEGKKAASSLAKLLGKNMKQHMKKGGPMDALNFCSNEAYELTQSVNDTLPEGVKVKRISSMNRSPINKPNKNEQRILDSLKSLQESNVALPNHLIEKVDGQTYKFYKPLTINNVACLKCHGTLKDGDLKEAIAARYPDDKALGYKMNDLRGAIVVTIEQKK